MRKNTTFITRLATLLVMASVCAWSCEPAEGDKPEIPVNPTPDPDPIPKPDPDPIPGPEPAPGSITLAEIIEQGDGSYDVAEVLVMAVGSHNAIVSDGTAVMLLYDPDKTTEVGDVVALSGSTTVFNGVPEWNKPKITPVRTMEVGYPEAVELTSSVIAGQRDNSSIIYGYASGTKSGYILSVGGQKLNTYSNVTVPDGEVTVYGYTIGYASKYDNVNFVVTSYVDNEPAPDPDPKPDPTPDPDPDPSPNPDPNPSPAYATWAELPHIDDMDGDGRHDTDGSLYYAVHFTDMKAPGGGAARNYTVCYSGEHHCPVWVAAPRHSMYVGGTDRTDAYTQDPDIPSDIQYRSKSKGGGCNKGHMLGSAERTGSYVTNRQVFYYTNIAPQLMSGFNTGGGGWNLLEDWVDRQVCSVTLYTVIGTYFDKYTDAYGETCSPKVITFGGRNDVDMPTMFYYVLLRTKKGNLRKSVKDCSASELKCAAFVRTHTNDHKGQKVCKTDLMSVSDLEKLTGFTYFENVPNAPKSTVNASDWGL